MTVTPSRSPLNPAHEGRAVRSLLWTKDVHREVLPNGLTLLVQPDHSAPVVAVVTHVKAGFFDEPDRWIGISHVLEHMFFKGTQRRGVGAIARETKAAGGYLNAGTGYDHTSYFTVLPASGLATALDIQADALRNSVIDPGELARELQVIIQEAKRKRDTPGAVAHETLHELMFDRHRIRRWRIGTEEQLARLTRDDLWSYYRSRYVPERTIVSIAGAFDPDKALELARAAYGSWPVATGPVDASPDEPSRREVRARTLRGDITHAELALGWRAVPPLHEDAPALDVAAAVLGLGRGSWLYRKLREPGVVTSVSAHNYAPTELGVFSIGADLIPGNVPQAIELGHFFGLDGAARWNRWRERRRRLQRPRRSSMCHFWIVSTRPWNESPGMTCVQRPVDTSNRTTSPPSHTCHMTRVTRSRPPEWSGRSPLPRSGGTPPREWCGRR